MQDENPNTNLSTPPKKPRSPVERAIVWGGIALLAGILVFEARQKASYGSSIKRVQKAFQEQDLTETYHTLNEVQSMISGSHTRNQTPHANKSWRRLELRWASLFKDYRMEFVLENDGDNPLVIGFSTPLGQDPEPLEPQPDTDTSNPSLAHMMPTMGGGGPMGSGRGAGGRQSRGRGMIALALREEIAGDIQLSDDQRTKLTELQETLREAMSKLQETPEDAQAELLKEIRVSSEQATRELLEVQQFARLQQLLWRELGMAALERDDAVQALGLNDDEQTQLRAIFAERQSSQASMRGAEPEAMTQWREQWDSKIRETLNEAQLKQWSELLGPPPPEPKRPERQGRSARPAAEQNTDAATVPDASVDPAAGKEEPK